MPKPSVARVFCQTLNASMVLSLVVVGIWALVAYTESKAAFGAWRTQVQLWNFMMMNPEHPWLVGDAWSLTVCVEQNASSLEPSCERLAFALHLSNVLLYVASDTVPYTEALWNVSWPLAPTPPDDDALTTHTLNLTVNDEAAGESFAVRMSSSSSEATPATPTPPDWIFEAKRGSTTAMAVRARYVQQSQLQAIELRLAIDPRWTFPTAWARHAAIAIETFGFVTIACMALWPLMLGCFTCYYWTSLQPSSSARHPDPLSLAAIASTAPPTPFSTAITSSSPPSSPQPRGCDEQPLLDGANARIPSER